MRFVILCCLIFTFTQANAQSKEALRYEIDAKRGGMSYTSKDALPRGREFKRLDNTYYVGWMFEGAYKFDHAADFIGFKAAAEQLDKALILLDKDFRKQIRTRTSDVFEYLKVMKYQRDWDYIAYVLAQCYSNTDEGEKLWSLLQKCKKADLQLEVYSETFNYMAWTVHRNRFYTNNKYPFLKKSIDENEAYANKLLDSSALKIKRDATLNKTIFSVNYENEKMPGVWHYKSILYSYQLNIESGGYYYEKLRSTSYFPDNNYATFCLIQGKFKEAEQYYKKAKEQDAGDKRMKESFYYSSIINSYANENKKGIEELKSLIKANGSTPGFGWYNIALARNLIYDGQLDIAKRYALKAEQFKEIHIGTTLGQSHYDFSVSLMNLFIKMREIEQVKFLNKNWWFTPDDLATMSKLTIEKYGLQFLIINQFATNPERERVIYKLFSTESTVSFDEIWQLMEGFSVNYFLERFEQEIAKDKRYQIKRYYKLFTAKLLMKKKRHKEAIQYLESALNEMQVDPQFEKLFQARCLEAMAICHKEIGEENKIQSNLDKIYSIYPQLIPFSGLQMKMHIQSNASTKEHKELISQIKKSNIHWVERNSESPYVVTINFSQKGTFKIADCSISYNSKPIELLYHSFSYKTNDEAAKLICNAIFNIGNDDNINEEKADEIKSKK